MFENYHEISKDICSYVDEALTTITFSPEALYAKVEQTYGVSLSETELTNLEKTISFAKKMKKNYESGVKNSYNAVTDWGNALQKSLEIVVEEEAKARTLAYGLAKKICIVTYKGPLTVDTMRELKENGYDGTYGSATMMQMFALYMEKERLEEETKKQSATILQNQAQLNSFNQKYTEQFQTLQRVTAERDTLKNQNSSLYENYAQQNQIIRILSEKVEMLSKSIPVQIIETIKSFFRGNIMTESDQKEEGNRMMH